MSTVQQLEKNILNLFISQDFESLNPNHFSTIKSVISLIEEQSGPLCHLKLTSGRNVYTTENYQEEFENSFGVQYCSSNLRSLRLNQLSQSKSIVFIQTSKLNNFSNFELGYNLNRSSNDILPMLFIVLEEFTSPNSNPIEDLIKSYPGIPIGVIRFIEMADVKIGLVK